MANKTYHSFGTWIRPKERRQFLRYLIGSGIGTVMLGFFPKVSDGLESSLEDLCGEFPYNSRCQDYLPGVRALDSKRNPIAADTLLSSAEPGPVFVKGLPETDVAYLVIEQGPKIATYGIKPICTHLGCTVKWHAEQKHFICPCHGSQYDPQGRVVHGPAKRALPLVTVVVKQNQIRLVDRAPAIDPR